MNEKESLKRILRVVPDPALHTDMTDVLTFLLADVRGYTRFTQEQGDEAAAELAAKFAGLVQGEVEAGGGQLLELRGDEALAVFRSPRQALRAAVQLQARFAHEEELDPSLPLKVGIGLDSGEAVRVGEGYRGGALNLAARLCSLAGPNEVLASEGVIHLARKMDGLEYAERGTHQLKGFADPVKVIEVVPLGQKPLSDSKTAEGSDVRPGDLPIGGFLGALPAGMLIARDPELAKILAALDAVSAGAGQMVLLAGEPGVGKTRLAQEATLAARNRGFLLTTGSCYEPQQAVPFYPFLDALASAYLHAPPSIRAEVRRHWPHLGRLLPNEQIPLPPASPDSHEEHQRLFWAVTGFFQALAEVAPVAILLDDLHWADGSTLDLLQHLVRHTRGHRVLVLGTYRDVEVDRRHPLERAILDLERQRLVERMKIRRLELHGTAALVSAAIGTSQVSSELADLLHRQTDGNPFFIQQMVRALVEAGEAHQHEGQWILREADRLVVPESVREVIAQRVSRLSAEAQTVLLEASVLGQTFAFDDLLAMNGRSESQLEDALEEAVRAGLLRESIGDDYAFNHALTQHALYADLSGRKKRRLHLAAAEALDRLPETTRQQRAAELAQHLLEGGEAAQALPYAVLVGDRAAAAFAHGNAATYYHLALELTQQLGDRVREAEVREKLGGLLTATIQYAEALAMLEQASQLYRAVGDRESEARVVAQIGRVHFANGTAEPGISRLQSWLESPSPRPVGERAAPELTSGAQAALNSVLASLFLARDRYEESLTRAEQAAELARPSGIGGVLAEAEVRRGSVLPMLGRWREGLQVLEQGLLLAEEAGDLFSLCRGLQYASGIHLAQGRLATSREHMERALRVAERMDNRRQIATTTYGLGLHAFIQGERTQANALAERALEIMHSLDGFWLSVLQSAALSLALSPGEWAAMPWPLEQCMTLSERGGELPAMRQERLVAENELVQGRAAAAITLLDSLMKRPGLEEQKRNGLAPLLAWSRLESGDLIGAEAMVGEGIERAGAEHLNLALISWLRVRGMILSQQGRWEEAAQAFRESVSGARTVPYSYAEARTLHEWGRMHARQEDTPRAIEHLRAALVIFERLNAQEDAWRTEQIMAEVSRGSEM